MNDAKSKETDNMTFAEAMRIEMMEGRMDLNGVIVCLIAEVSELKERVKELEKDQAN